MPILQGTSGAKKFTERNSNAKRTTRSVNTHLIQFKHHSEHPKLQAALVTEAPTEVLVDTAATFDEEVNPIEEITQDVQAQDPPSKAEKAEPPPLTPEVLAPFVAQRRNFAIISHPDAGKTTLTEKLLLYGGAIQQAGEVKARRDARHATSDWMALERQRGISITSTALTFEYNGITLNLLDTPGHQDFSEDTYRTLAAADNAVMLVDGAKGIEPQTRKLFEVARMRRLPIFTFVNKMDRPAMNGFEIVEQLEREFGLSAYPVVWPIGSGDRFCGLYQRSNGKVLLYQRTPKGQRRTATLTELHVDDPKLAEFVEPDLMEQLREDVELLEVLGGELDRDAMLRGEITPLFFGSAASNFGIDFFLSSFIDAAAPPGHHTTKAGMLVPPTSPIFSGFVFKLQANMDPKHRDKVAFVRVCSGRFEKGMKVKVARSGKVVSLNAPQKMFANDRVTVTEGYAGDVIGLTNPGAFAIGDTLYCGPTIAFPPIPTFSPELFSYLRCGPSQRKPFIKGVEGLLGEGAVQVLYSCDDFVTDPIMAAVGQLQYEVVQYRMKEEYGVDTTLEPLPYTLARWVVGGWPVLEGLPSGRLFNTLVVKDGYGRPVMLFRNVYAMNAVLAEHGKVLGELSPFALPPEGKV